MIYRNYLTWIIILLRGLDGTPFFLKITDKIFEYAKIINRQRTINNIRDCEETLGRAFPTELGIGANGK
jgi:hypothetical protein